MFSRKPTVYVCPVCNRSEWTEHCSGKRHQPCWWLVCSVCHNTFDTRRGRGFRSRTTEGGE